MSVAINNSQNINVVTTEIMFYTGVSIHNIQNLNLCCYATTDILFYIDVTIYNSQNINDVTLPQKFCSISVSAFTTFGT